jgi:hypothetical protein
LQTIPPYLLILHVVEQFPASLILAFTLKSGGPEPMLMLKPIFGSQQHPLQHTTAIQKLLEIE